MGTLGTPDEALLDQESSEHNPRLVGLIHPGTLPSLHHKESSPVASCKQGGTRVLGFKGCSKIEKAP